MINIFREFESSRSFVGRLRPKEWLEELKTWATGVVGVSGDSEGPSTLGAV